MPRIRHLVGDLLSAEAQPARFFVDSNTIGYIVMGTPLGQSYLTLIAELVGSMPSISVTARTEILSGLPILDAGNSLQRQTASMMRAMLDAFEEVAVDPETEAVAETLRREARRAGHPIGADHQAKDLLIASTAIRHRSPLISHNYRDFINIDALDLRTLATGTKSPPRMTWVPQ